MLKRTILILLVLPVSLFFTYGQKLADYNTRLMTITPTLSRQVSYLLQDSTSWEIIIYSVFNLDYHIVISKGKNNYNLFFFRFEETDTLPILMYYSYIPDTNKNFKELFNKDLYWKKRIFYDYDPANNYDGLLDGNKSDFYFYGADRSIIAEFHLPTFTNENPLQVNHQFLLDLRMDLILKYIFGKEDN